MLDGPFDCMRIAQRLDSGRHAEPALGWLSGADVDPDLIGPDLHAVHVQLKYEKEEFPVRSLIKLLVAACRGLMRQSFGCVSVVDDVVDGYSHFQESKFPPDRPCLRRSSSSPEIAFRNEEVQCLPAFGNISRKRPMIGSRPTD